MNEYTKTIDGKLAQLVVIDIRILQSELSMLESAIIQATTRADEIKKTLDKARELGILQNE